MNYFFFQKTGVENNRSIPFIYSWATLPYSESKGLNKPPIRVHHGA